MLFSYFASIVNWIPSLFPAFDIHRGEHNKVCALAFGKFLAAVSYARAASSLSGGTDGQGDQDLIGMQSRIAASEVSSFQTLDRLQRFRCNDIFPRGQCRQALLGHLTGTAEAAPSRSEVFPVMILPSGSSIAAAGAPVSSRTRL